MRIRNKYVFVLGLTALLILGFFQSAEACCVYNRSAFTLSFYLDCGLFCGNSWTISANNHECRPDKGGTVRICDPSGCEVHVDAHGWVSVTNQGDIITVTSKHEDGSVRERITCDLKGYFW